MPSPIAQEEGRKNCMNNRWETELYVKGLLPTERVLYAPAPAAMLPPGAGWGCVF